MTDNRVRTTRGLRKVTPAAPITTVTEDQTFQGDVILNLPDGMLATQAGVIGTATIDSPMVFSDNELSLSYGNNLQVAAGELDTIQGIKTTDSPTFAGLTLDTLAGVLKASTGVVGQAVAGVDYLAAEADPIAMAYLDQSVKKAAAPLFNGLFIVAGQKLVFNA